MLKNYIKFAVRFLSRNKLYTIINVSGLTLGMASFLLIINFVQQEMSFDTFHEHADDIYRVNLEAKTETGTRKASAISPPMGPALADELPEVITAVRFRHADNVLVRIGDDQFYQDRVFYVDPSFFDVFSFPLISGETHQVLKKKNSAVISEALAEKYFAGQNPLGKILTIDDDLVVKVTGIIGKTSVKSHLQFDLLISFDSFEVPHGYPVTLETWGWTSFPTYVRLHENTDMTAIEDKLHAFIVKHMGEETAERLSLYLQPVKEIHLQSRNITERDGTAPKGDITYTYGLLAIAFLILGIAVFNFANLSTSLSLKRIREIGVRKTLGARRGGLFWQYLTESLLLVFGSFVLAVTCLEIFSAPLSGVLQTDISIPLELHKKNLIFYMLIIAAVGSAGGLYPALFLSSYSPTKALKGQMNIKRANRVSVKNVLVIFQFFITIGLIAASLVVSRQMNFLSERSLGFKHDRVIALQMTGEALHQRYATTKQELLQNSYVEGVSAAGNLFDGQNGSVPVQEFGNDESRSLISLFGAHFDFGNVMNFEFIEGRDFSETFANDSSNFILNEAAIKMFGWEEPIGKKLLLNDVWEGEVIGVVKDFHYASMHEEITPMVLYIPRTYQDYIFVKTKPGQVSTILSGLEKDWQRINPDMPFDYRFIDDHINQLYQSDQQFTAIINSFSILAIFLACVGLYGIISFQVEAKIKEIGIRKVLGASVHQVVSLLSSRFFILILIAAFMAVPLSWFFLDKWLVNFAYHIHLGTWQFVVAILLAFLLAGTTIGIKTIRAALANPADALKEE